MAAAYPDLVLQISNADTVGQILNKAQALYSQAVQSGQAFAENARLVGFMICGINSPTKRELAAGVPPSVYQNLVRAEVIQRLQQWVTVEVVNG